MTDFVWLLDSAHAPFGTEGVSVRYRVPSGHVNIDPIRLAGSRVWILLRGPSNRILKSIRIAKVEQIIEGYYADDVLVTTEQTESFRVAENYVRASSYEVYKFGHLPIGLTEIDSAQSTSLAGTVKRSVRTALTAPNSRSLDMLALNLSPKSDELLARTAIRAIVSRLTLDHVWADAAGLKLGAFANYALALIEKTHPDRVTPALVEELRVLDPLSSLERQALAGPDVDYVSPISRAPLVDMEFTEIEPDSVYVRKFLSANPRLSTVQAALDKTNHAESVHQEMLRDTAIFLRSCGIVPFESGSIDLMYETNNVARILEIKSATAENILAQAAKGAFQLACYHNAFIDVYGRVQPTLILHLTGNDELERYAVAALQRLGVQTLFYDPGRSWPDRIAGLL